MYYLIYNSSGELFIEIFDNKECLQGVIDDMVDDYQLVEETENLDSMEFFVIEGKQVSIKKSYKVE
jgi:hypothetical protein